MIAIGEEHEVRDEIGVVRGYEVIFFFVGE